MLTAIRDTYKLARNYLSLFTFSLSEIFMKKLPSAKEIKETYNKAFKTKIPLPEGHITNKGALINLLVFATIYAAGHFLLPPHLLHRFEVFSFAFTVLSVFSGICICALNRNDTIYNKEEPNLLQCCALGCLFILAMCLVVAVMIACVFGFFFLLSTFFEMALR
jgi:hypothetical protein